jgi:uncharacterized protein (DUF1800 family)
MAYQDDLVRHLLRRAGFGATAEEFEFYVSMGFDAAVDHLVNYDRTETDVDEEIGQPGYVGITIRGQFAPNTNILDARQRWLFRLVHGQHPLQEKMALFWHNHFATGYSKIAGIYNGTEATRMMAAKPGEDPGGVRGQVELLRQYALGSFRDLLVEIARDPAMLVWLDGRTNTRSKPQENFAREIMELFTMGVGFYTEADVYAGARVFTGWSLRRQGVSGDPASHYDAVYEPAQHDTAAKTFSFPVYPDGGRTIPARPGSQGTQDVLDLIDGLARHPETARRLARRLWDFFVSEVTPPDEQLVSRLATTYLQSNTNLRPVVSALLRSAEFGESSCRFTRYSWPVEFLVRALKEVGWSGFSVYDALTPLSNMGQQLYDPPSVAGWKLGGGWFSTVTMLARMNFAATLASRQKSSLAAMARGNAGTAAQFLSFCLDRLPAAEYSRQAYSDLQAYLDPNGKWTGSDSEMATKAPGLVHLIVGSPEYQFL